MHPGSSEIQPHIDSESWIDFSKSKIGYEINFTKYFFEPKEFISSDLIKNSIASREEVIVKLMKELFV